MVYSPGCSKCITYIIELKLDFPTTKMSSSALLMCSNRKMEIIISGQRLHWQWIVYKQRPYVIFAMFRVSGASCCNHASGGGTTVRNFSEIIKDLF